MTFSELGLGSQLVSALAARGLTEPTPVQREAIPAILRGGDVIASSPTGSGKTLAFLAPIAEQVLGSTSRGPVALVLAPTRELAMQIGQELRGLARTLPTRLRSYVVYGGVSINPQMLALRGGADVVIATPGRLLDLVDNNALSLGRVRTLVLDEADRLLALGFEDELARVLALLPAQRQNVLVSATFPPAVEALATRTLRDPTRVEIAALEIETAAIEHRAIEIDVPRRTALLKHLLAEHGWPSALVFVATTYATEHVAEKLQRAGIAAAPLHGQLSQGARVRALGDLREGRIRVLVATDVAARGLDLPGLPAVVSYDLPRSPADYVHRAGRTGRAGATGTSVCFVTAATFGHYDLIERRNGLSVTRERLAGFEPTEVPAAPSDGGIKGKRKSKKDKLREAAAAKATKPDSSR